MHHVQYVTARCKYSDNAQTDRQTHTQTYREKENNTLLLEHS